MKTDELYDREHVINMEITGLIPVEKQEYSSAFYFAACPGGEGAVLKTVGPKGLAGSNPVCSAVAVADLVMQRIVVPPYVGSNPISHLFFMRLSYNWQYIRLQPGWSEFESLGAC